MAMSRTGPVPVLSDAVVTLRAHREEDVPACLEQSVDPVSVRWTRVPVPYRLDDAKRWVREVMPGGWVTDTEWGFAVEALDEGRPRYAGTVSLRNLGPGRAEIAYGAHPWARGRGLMERALRLLLEWGFAPVADGGRDLQTVIWWAEAGNWASRKLAWRLGFDCHGPVRHWLEERDGLVDAWVGTLTRDAPREPASPWLELPRIETADLRLRALEEGDLDALVEGCSDAETSRWIAAMPAPYLPRHAEEFLAQTREAAATGSGLHWAIAAAGDDRFLGVVAVHRLEDPRGAELGYWLHPRGRGAGLAAQAARAAARHALVPAADGGLGLHRVWLVAAADNHPSRRTAEAAGFGLIGIERAGVPCRDGVHDAARYDLLPADLTAPR